MNKPNDLAEQSTKSFFCQTLKRLAVSPVKDYLFACGVIEFLKNKVHFHLSGEDGVCKVAGTTTVRPLTNQDEPRDASEEEAYATPIDNPPEFVSKEEDYPVTHAALECIKEGRFSTASDVYAFGVFMWEVFTYGCPAYSKTKDGVYIRKKTAEIKQHVSNY